MTRETSKSYQNQHLPDPEPRPTPAPQPTPHSLAPTSRFLVEWRPIPGLTYEASSLGMIRHAKSKRILSPTPDRDGYLAVVIQQDGHSRFFYTHRLVLIAFEGEPPSTLHQAGHRDGSRQNNAIWNLRWLTPKENSDDRRRHKAIRAFTATVARAKRGSRIKIPGRFLGRCVGRLEVGHYDNRVCN